MTCSLLFNGIGWENVWGIWNGITPRDGEATRRMATVERGIALFLVSKDWEPFFPMLHFGVFASRWPLGNEAAWTIINHNEYSVVGPQIELPAVEGMHYFDLYHGVELAPERQGDKIVLKFAIDVKDYGAPFASKSPVPEALKVLLTKMKTLTATPLASFPHEPSILPQEMMPVRPTKPPSGAPSSMVQIPEGDFLFKVKGVEIGEFPG